MRITLLSSSIVLGCCVFAHCATGAQLVLPQERQAYYCDEAIELAVADLATDVVAILEIVPESASAGALKASVRGDGSTVTAVLPPGALAPGNYAVQLDGSEAVKLTIAAGVWESTFLISQTIGWDKLREAGADFILGNAFQFGRLAGGQPKTTGLRASRSGGMNAFERAVAADLPTVVYMYWTGYVTHKPFGSEKSWAAADMGQAMRLLNFHTAQRLRRFGPNIVSIGTLDEPGLSWGRTPAGGMASGFPNWDEKTWYEDRGWQYTQDIASRSDEDWMRYMTIRCGILGQRNAQAASDLKTVWPGTVFSTDLYAPHAIMDGTDPLNQRVNDIPSSHVFVDWGIDRLGAYSGIMLEKAHAPASKLAHAMNGQLFGRRVPQPGQTHAYRACINGMLAAGLASNWWLNTGGMEPQDLAAVNEPVKRYGPIFREMDNRRHDVAVLWSFTEIAMRQKEMAAREATKTTGEQIKLMVASLPENSAVKDGTEININAYSIGGDYKESVLTAHYALTRAGYPAHIIHEHLLPDGVLKNYKTLVICGQTFDLPPQSARAIADFTAAGGRVVIDESTTVEIPQAIRAAVNLRGIAFRWNALFTQDAKRFATPREASYYQTNYFMDQPVRDAVSPLKTAMRQTDSVPRAETESKELLFERHVGGEGQLAMVASGFEQLPQIGDDDSYFIYNYAPCQATFHLTDLPQDSVVYAIERGDWSHVRRLDDPHAPIRGEFEPGEMKLYLIAPRQPGGLDVSAEVVDQGIHVTARLKNLKMPWPLNVTVRSPSGEKLYDVHRATGPDGVYQEQFPIGSNAAAGVYSIAIVSPMDLAAGASIDYQAVTATPQRIAYPVRVFDGSAIQAFLGGKPDLVIAVGSPQHEAHAGRLAAELTSRGIACRVRAESEVLRRVTYPRVWNPYVQVYHATGAEQPLGERPVEQEITLHVSADGTVRATTSDGKDAGGDWRKPKTLVTIAGEGLVDYSGDREVCYEAGVKLYIDERRRISAIRGEATEEQTTAEFRARWARPWTQLTSHVGAYQLPPQLPEAYTTDSHLILLGDSTSSEAVAALQASDLLLQVADDAYPGPGKALISFAWSPFAVEKNVILIAACDDAGLAAGVEQLLKVGASR